MSADTLQLVYFAVGLAAGSAMGAALTMLWLVEREPKP